MAESKKSMDDVAKPGTSAPDATSRPIITDHRNSISRPTPMVSEDNKPGSKKPVLSGTVRKVISPISAPEEKTEEKPEEVPATAEPETEQKQAEGTVTAPQEEKATEPTKEPGSEGSAVVDAVASQTSDKKQLAEEVKKEEERQAALQKLIEEKTYNLPIGETSSKRNARVSTVILLVLVLVVVGGYAALDAGIIKTNIPLPVHFFK